MSPSTMLCKDPTHKSIDSKIFCVTNNSLLYYTICGPNIMFDVSLYA